MERTFDIERTMHDDALEHFRNCYAAVMESRGSVMRMQGQGSDTTVMNEHTIEPTIETANDDIGRCAYCGSAIEWDEYAEQWWHCDEYTTFSNRWDTLAEDED